MEIQRLYRVKESEEHSYAGRIVEHDSSPGFEQSTDSDSIVPVITWDRARLRLWFYPHELEEYYP